ncbi:hypothetical protein [Nostoc sp.]
MNQWVAELGSYQPNLQQTPSEVKALAGLVSTSHPDSARHLK